jgi:RNA polymerase sigma factor (sigma-70 family)
LKGNLPIREELIEDYKLWLLFKEGNDKAFYCLYDQYADKLYKYGSHFSRDKEFIKDCIHDLFLDLYKYRKKLSETDNIQFYLFRSIRRIIRKEHIKVIPLVYNEMINSPDCMVFSHEHDLIAAETESEGYKALYDAMKTLSNRQREGLSLKFEHKHSYPEIAEIMGISVESARTIIYRALKELRSCIEQKAHLIQLLFFYSHYKYS